MTIENVKSFRSATTFTFCPGVNYFVGDNNSGKSTVLEALHFLFDGPSASKWQPDSFYSADAVGPTRVEAEIAGDLDAFVAQKDFKVLEKYVFEDRGESVLRLERNSESRVVNQGGKDKNLTVRTVCWWHPVNQQFENPTGIDAKVKTIFDFEAIWATAQPGDHLDFANTKTLGRLVDAAFKRFQDTPRWQALAAAHEAAFAEDDNDSFAVETKRLAEGLKQLVDDQYGSAVYRFAFGLPDSTVFMKQGSLRVDEGSGETPVESKGTGMQRAIALGVIQLYARSEALRDEGNPRPLILMLDEPETWLHPTAQLNLGDALNVIGEAEQVFVITHSPYLIRKFDSESHSLTVLTGKGQDREIHAATTFGLFGRGEPSWGEINYRAFGICSNDFHNELYGRIQAHIEGSAGEGKVAREGEIDDFLCTSGPAQRTKVWTRPQRAPYDVTLPMYVRNSIHHPENQLNDPVTPDELRDATALLVSVVEKLPEQEL